MTEGEQQAPPEKRKNPVVEAARAGVRTALEANKAVQDWRNSLTVESKEKANVYRSWINAMDRVVGAMTEADKRKFSTKMYEMKMRLAAVTFGTLSPVLDFAVNVISFLPRKAVSALGWLTMLGNVPTGLAIVGVGKAMDRVVEAGVTRVPGVLFAEKHAMYRISRYKVREALTIARRGGEFVKQTTKNILTGFAYPEGKPVKPMAK